MKKASQLKQKTPKRQKKASKRPEKEKGARNRSLWLEILFLVTLGTFAFAAVGHWLERDDGIVLRFSSSEPVEVAEVPMLYESPSARPTPEPNLSDIFMPSVQYWEDDLLDWGDEYGVDPNLIATLMQIESCGNPDISSWAGAMGLFQVMPFHFETSEDPLDPETNAFRGISYFKSSLDASDGHAGLAMAGYNGGIGVISRLYDDWPSETQRYYRWGSGIYREVSAGWDSSPTLENWLSAGGASLCEEAEASLGLASSE